MVQLQQATQATGELIYRGRVQARDGTGEHLYTYERWITQTESETTATHITYDPDGSMVVLQQATSEPEGRLSVFEEIHGQTGLSGTALRSDGIWQLDTVVGDRVHGAAEVAGDPVVAGPTLFGFVLERWDPILAGEVQHVDFPVLGDARTYRFDLALDSADEDTVTVAMKAASPLVRLAVPAGRIVFERDTGKVLSYAGLVPPLIEHGGRLSPLDGYVTYTFVADDYR